MRGYPASSSCAQKGLFGNTKIFGKNYLGFAFQDAKGASQAGRFWGRGQNSHHFLFPAKGNSNFFAFADALQQFREMGFEISYREHLHAFDFIAKIIKSCQVVKMLNYPEAG